MFYSAFINVRNSEEFKLITSRGVDIKFSGVGPCEVMTINENMIIDITALNAGIWEAFKRGYMTCLGEK